MLNLTASTLHRSYEYPISPEAAVEAAGCCLVTGKVIGSVTPSTGAEGARFVGIAASQELTLFSQPIVENFEVPANGKVVLTHEPESGTLFCAAKSSVQATGKEVDVGTENAGKIVSIAYRYAPTTIEARFKQGDGPAGGAAALHIGTITTVVAGTIFTTEYDTTKNWAEAHKEGNVIGAGANGRITFGQASEIKAPIPNARVVSAPTSGSAELGLYFSA